VIVPPIAGVVSELSLGGTVAPTSTQAASSAPTEPATFGASEAAGTGPSSGSFGSELTEAISSLEKSQQSADSASQALATGTASNPESAVVTVEDAQLAMQLASQMRSKATEAVQTIFQTQV
jgi:flagellar hook-basal body complex protein FliE